MKRILAALIVPMIFTAGPSLARNYDCSKPGNANKAVCKGKATTAAKPPAAKPAPAAPAAKAATATSAKTTRNYDCTKAGNANKAVCKGAAPSVAAAPPAKPAAPAVAARPAARATASRSTVAPGAATGKCKDGTETHAVHHQGACSRHGGVAAWY